MTKKMFLIAMAACLMLLAACSQGQGPKGRGQESGDGDQDSVASMADLLSAEDSLEQLLTEMPMPKAADELFDDFIFNFSANKKLQKSRIVFPLPVVKGVDTTYVEKGGWQMDHFFMRQGYYTLLFDSEEQMELARDTSLRQATVEKILLKKNLVRSCQFSRVRGAWLMHEIRETAIDDNDNASFLAFYSRFATDKAFQLESLNRMVVFVGPDPDDDFSTMEGMITRDTWEAFAPQLPSKTLYNIVYGARGREPGAVNEEQGASGKVQEKIFIMRGIANGLELELRFRRVGNRWLLMKMTT